MRAYHPPDGGRRIPRTRDPREMLDTTRSANEQYESARYREPGRPPETGLNARLETIEEALVRLARAVDER
jgi:hypothetical protein